MLASVVWSSSTKRRSISMIVSAIACSFSRSVSCFCFGFAAFLSAHRVSTAPPGRTEAASAAGAAASPPVGAVVTTTTAAAPCCTSSDTAPGSAADATRFSSSAVATAAAAAALGGAPAGADAPPSSFRSEPDNSVSPVAAAEREPAPGDAAGTGPAAAASLTASQEMRP